MHTLLHVMCQETEIAEVELQVQVQHLTSPIIGYRERSSSTECFSCMVIRCCTWEEVDMCS